MKFNLQISTDDPNELARLVGFLNGTAALAKSVPAAAPLQPSSLQPAAQFAAVDLDADAADYHAATVPGELDSTGLPWDERIHAKTKAKNADGSWRGRRGVDDATVAAVETQLRSVAPVVQPAPFVPAPMTPQPAQSPEALFGPAPAVITNSPAFAASMGAPVERQIDENFQPPAFLQTQPQPMPAPAPQPMPAPVAADAPPPSLTFQQLMAAISQGLRDKKIDNAWLGQLVAHFQLPGIPNLANSHASLMPNVVAELRKVGVVA